MNTVWKLIYKGRPYGFRIAVDFDFDLNKINILSDVSKDYFYSFNSSTFCSAENIWLLKKVG